ncbi:MAG: DinB family protein [Bacteroidota bacterium]
MADEFNRERIIGRLSDHAAELEGLTQGLSPALLRERTVEGRWSLHEYVVRLSILQDFYIERIARILVEKEPSLGEPPHESGDGYLVCDFQSHFVSFREQRKTLVTLLRSLEAKQWDREGSHPNLRHYTVELCMESLMRREEEILYQMFMVLFGMKE